MNVSVAVSKNETMHKSNTDPQTRSCRKKRKKWKLDEKNEGKRAHDLCLVCILL